MRNTLIGLFFLALFVGGCTSVTTMFNKGPLGLTEGVVCSGGHYEYEGRWQTIGGDFEGNTAGSFDPICVTDSGREDVSAAARWTLTGYWVVAYFIFFNLLRLALNWQIRRRKQAA